MLFWKSAQFLLPENPSCSYGKFLKKILIKTRMLLRYLSVMANQHFLIKSSMSQKNSKPDQLRVSVTRNPLLC